MGNTPTKVAKTRSSALERKQDQTKQDQKSKKQQHKQRQQHQE